MEVKFRHCIMLQLKINKFKDTKKYVTNFKKGLLWASEVIQCPQPNALIYWGKLELQNLSSSHTPYSGRESNNNNHQLGWA